MELHGPARVCPVPNRTSVRSCSAALDLVSDQHMRVAQAGAPEVVQWQNGIDLAHFDIEYLASVVAAARLSELEEVRAELGLHPRTVASGL